MQEPLVKPVPEGTAAGEQGRPASPGRPGQAARARAGAPRAAAAAAYAQPMAGKPSAHGLGKPQ